MADNTKLLLAAAAASKSFVLSAMLRLCNLLSYNRLFLLALGCAEALVRCSCLYLLEAIPLRLCAFYRSAMRLYIRL